MGKLDILEQEDFKEKAFTEEERASMQLAQKEAIYKDIKMHIANNIKVKSKEYAMQLDSKVAAAKLTVSDELAKYRKEAEIESEKQLRELKELYARDKVAYVKAATNYKIASKNRADKMQGITKQAQDAVTLCKSKLDRELNSTIKDLETGHVITDLSIDYNTRENTYTCNECGALNIIKYNEMPSVQFGTTVNNVATSFDSLDKRVIIPVYKCRKCNKAHMFPTKTIIEVLQFAKIYLSKYARSAKDEKINLDKSGISYVLKTEVFKECTAIELNTDSILNSSSSNRLGNDKLNMAKNLANGNARPSSDDSADIFRKLDEIANNNIKNKDIEDQSKAVSSFLDNIVNTEMIEKMNIDKLKVINDVAYEVYDVEDLDELSFDELTSYGKLYSKEIQIYLNKLDPNMYINKDVVDVMANIQTDGNETELPVELLIAITERYTEFQKVNVETMFDYI